MNAVQTAPDKSQAALCLVLAAFFIGSGGAVTAQEGEAEGASGGPFYVVQAGASLWGVTVRFGVPPEALQKAKRIVDRPGKTR